MKKRHGVILGAVLVGLSAAGLAAEGPTRQIWPANNTVTLRDYGYRDWPTALVQYTVPVGTLPGPVCLKGTDGKPVPAQVDGDTLAFVAALAKGATETFTMAKGSPATSSLHVTQATQAVEVGNEFFALRLPPVGKQDFTPAVAAATVPGPLTAWQAKDGPWMGATRFVCTRQIAGLESKILRNGPAVFEYEARYRFAPQGEYACRVTVLPGVERADVVEEYDIGVRTEGRDFLLLELHRGFEPGTVGWIGDGGESGGMKAPLKLEAYPEFVAARGKADANKQASVGGRGETPLPPRPEADMVLLEKILPAGPWGGNKVGVEIGGALTDPKALPANRVCLVPTHAGSWRRSLALTSWYKPGAGITVALPISTRRCTWYAEVTDDISPFSSHEHDSGLNESYGRREWTLCFNGTPEAVRPTAGYIGLDRFKDWLLDWPENAKPGDYPRAAFTKAQVARLKQSLAQHPDKADLEKYYVFSGTTEDAITHARQAIGGWQTREGMSMAPNWNAPGLTHYRQTQFLARYTALSDDALACPELPAELRTELRRALAAVSYLMSDPDMNPRGAGVHLGNNNMPINRTCAFIMAAGLLPDHPLYGYWMAQAASFIRFKLATYFTPDGVAIEPALYQLYGPLRYLADAVTVIHNTGGPDLAPQLLDNAWYLANLTMPDARYDGRRILPGMGNSQNCLESFYGFLIADAERLDKELAGRLQAVYRSAWPTEPLGTRASNHGGMAFRYLPDVPVSPKPLTTTVFPTYGVTFRAHAGTPDETALLFRIGNNWGHWDTDALNVILYSRGAPLSPGTGYQYIGGPLVEDNAIYHNQLKVGAYNQQEIFGRVDNELRDYGFGPSADYAVAARYYPPQAFSDRVDELWWNRHVLFLKSPQPAGPSYFVMRDTCTSATPRPSWWNWMNLEGADKISVDGQPFKAEDYPVNKKIPANMLTPRTGQTVEMQTDFGAGTWFWFADRRTFRPRITVNYDVNSGSRLGLEKGTFPKLPSTETKTVLEALGQPGEDFFYVVYPRLTGAPAPTVTKLAAGVLKVITSEATDYVFASDQPLVFNHDGVEFIGKAGAVRVFADRVALCLNSGSGKVGYKGYVLCGHGPLERVVSLAELKPAETRIDGGYEKQWQTVDIGDGLTVQGEMPFTARLEPGTVSIQTDGRTRQLFVTKPAWTDWIDYRVDGQQHMACWTDYPASGWGTYKNTALMALTVPEGKHTLEVRSLVYPATWTRPFRPTLRRTAGDAEAPRPSP